MRISDSSSGGKSLVAAGPVDAVVLLPELSDRTPPGPGGDEFPLMPDLFHRRVWMQTEPCVDTPARAIDAIISKGGGGRTCRS